MRKVTTLHLERKERHFSLTTPLFQAKLNDFLRINTLRPHLWNLKSVRWLPTSPYTGFTGLPRPHPISYCAPAGRPEAAVTGPAHPRLGDLALAVPSTCAPFLPLYLGARHSGLPQKTILGEPLLVRGHMPRPHTPVPLRWLLLPQEAAVGSAPRGPGPPRPGPPTHQVAQLRRLLLVVVQPPQGARPVLVHPQAHGSSASRVRRPKAPRARAPSTRTRRQIFPRAPRRVTSLPARARLRWRLPVGKATEAEGKHN